MKFHVEMTLLVLLIVLMYTKPQFLLNMTDCLLGKVLLVLSVLGVAHTYGRNAGILMALIVVLLFHSVLEGLENTEASDKSETDNTTDDESDSDEPKVEVEVEVEESSDKKSSEEDEEAEQEKAAAAKTTNTIVANEEAARPVSSQEQNDQEGFTIYGGGCGSVSGHGEPVAMPSSTEAFTPFM